VDVALTVLIGALLVWLVARALRRSRPSLDLLRPVLAAYGLRVLVAAILGLTSLNASIRGIDEVGFLADAHALARLPFTSHQWLAALTGHLTIQGVYNAGTLHIFLMALQIRLFGSTSFAMRASMAMLGAIGVCLIAAAVYELAGAKASRLTAWLLAVEPANIFFSTALHKEALLYLAVGMVGFGAASVWNRARVGALALMTLGCLVATAAGTYAGWFLAVACSAVLLHRAARRLSKRRRRAVGGAAVTACVVALLVPPLASRTQAELAGLQTSQNKNARLHSRLALEPVNLSTPGEVAINLPRRMFDLMLRPYPWQLSDTSQRLGLIETLFVLALLVVLVRQTVSRRGPLLSLTAPLLYPAVLLWIAYALAVANAGTGFRYRTVIIPLFIGMMFALEAGPRDPAPSSNQAAARAGRIYASAR
jgi:hypothetical protein